MFKKKDGFTLLEIIAVLIVMGILAVVAVSRSLNYDAEVYSGADTLKMHLRYAQTLAMNSNPNAGVSTVWGISCNGANAYWLFQGTDPAANFIRLPDDEKYINAGDRTINLGEKKISVSGFTVLFDNRGIPYSPDSATRLADNLPITVSPLSGGTNVGVTITPLTGYIP